MTTYDLNQQTIFGDAIRRLLMDLNSAGERAYKAQPASRTISVDSAVVRYLIANLRPGVAPADCG